MTEGFPIERPTFWGLNVLAILITLEDIKVAEGPPPQVALNFALGLARVAEAQQAACLVD